MKSVLLILVMLPGLLFAQSELIGKWELSPSLAYASENNMGTRGLIISSDITYNATQHFSITSHVGFFRSFEWSPEYRSSDFFMVSSFLTGVRLNHTSRFNKGKGFIKVSAGAIYANTYEVLAYNSNFVFENYRVSSADDSTELYERASIAKVSQFGGELALEGGRQLNDKITLGLSLQIYSYQIFGDIITLGPKVHIQL